MSAPYLMIDGYNLLHAAGLARMRYGPGDLERARQRLLALLSEKLRQDERRRCTVVFDAQQSPSDVPRQSHHHEITVLFAPSGQDADTEIERLIVVHPVPRRLIVVSGDHRLQQAARRRQASAIDSDEFLQELERRTSQSPRQSTASEIDKKSPSTSSPPPGSASEWEAAFGQIDVKSIADEVGREELRDALEPDPHLARLDALQQHLDDPDWLERWLKEPT